MNESEQMNRSNQTNKSELKGMVALITGSSRGIGKAIAKSYLEHGAEVILNCYHNVVQGRQTLEELSKYGKCTLQVFDVGDEKAVKAAFANIAELYKRIDVLVNNAAIIHDRTIEKMTVEEWNEVIRTNLCGPFLCTRAALPLLKAAKNASIINISSVIGQRGGFGQANYATSKAGLIGFTKTAALELAKYNICVNAIAPGFVKTDLLSNVPTQVLEKIIQDTPQGRLGTPEEIAHLATYLASPGSRFVTGQVFAINGGLYM